MDSSARPHADEQVEPAEGGTRRSRLPVRRLLLHLLGVVGLFLGGGTLIAVMALRTPDSLFRFVSWSVLDIALAVWVGLLVRKSPRILCGVLVCLAVYFAGDAFIHSARAIGDLPYAAGVAAAARNDVQTAERLFSENDRHYLSPGINLYRGMRLTRYGMVQDMRTREASLLGEASLGAGDPVNALKYYRLSVAVARQNGDTSPDTKELADFCDWLDSQIRSGDIWQLMKQDGVAAPVR